MNPEFSNCIMVAFVSDVEKIDNGKVILKAGKIFDSFNTADFSLDPQSQESKSSLLHSIATSLYIDKVTQDVAKRYSIMRRVIISFDVAGNPFILGSKSYPALVHIIPNLQADILKISHKSPDPYQF